MLMYIAQFTPPVKRSVGVRCSSNWDENLNNLLRIAKNLLCNAQPAHTAADAGGPLSLIILGYREIDLFSIAPYAYRAIDISNLNSIALHDAPRTTYAKLIIRDLY